MARVSGLSALKVIVGSWDRRVALNGIAPDTSAKERATTLATAVDAVMSVGYRLMGR